MAFVYKSEGPRPTMPLGTPKRARATLFALQSAFTSEASSFDRAVIELDELFQTRAWELVPEGTPYGSLDAMLLDVIGYDIDGLEKRYMVSLEKYKFDAIAPAADEHSRPSNGARPKDDKGRFVTEEPSARDCVPTGKRHNDTVEGVVARLKRERDRGDEQAAELLSKVEAGEIRPNRAAVLAGFRKPPKLATQAVNIIKRIDDRAALERIAEAIATRLMELGK